MFTGKQSLLIPADLKRVYLVAQTYPRFVRFFSSKSKVISETQKELFVEVHTRLFGIFPTKWTGRGLKREDRSIFFIQTQGLFKGLEALWLFEEQADGTLVSIKTTFSKPKLGIIGEQLFGKLLIERVTKKILYELSYKTLNLTRKK